MQLYNKYLDEFKNGLIGYATIGILIQSCVGSIAVMFALYNGHNFIQMLQVFIMTSFSLSFNGAVLSQQQPKIIFNIFLLTILAAIIIILLNALY